MEPITPLFVSQPTLKELNELTVNVTATSSQNIAGYVRVAQFTRAGKAVGRMFKASVRGSNPAGRQLYSKKVRAGK